MTIGIHANKLPVPVFINRLISALAKTDHQILVFGTFTQPFQKNPNVRYIGFFLFYFFNLSKKWTVLKYSLLLILRKKSAKQKLDSILAAISTNVWHDKAKFYPILYHQPDVLHVQWSRGISQFLWVQQFNIKLVVSLRGAHINISPHTDPLSKDGYIKSFPRIDGFHGVSKAICVEAAKYGADLNKCKVVFSGFDLKDFPKNNWQNDFEGLRCRPIRIISVGRSHWKKGYHFALDAMAILKQRELPFTYTIIGAAGSEELMFQRDQLDLNASVTFLGNVPFEGVKQHIREADVLLLPSVEEGIANVVLEAMLLGALVVTTDCGGMVESVENEKTGFVVPVRNVEAIANSIQRIKETDPEFLAAIVDAAYIRTASQHNEDKMVADMLELYKSVLT